jgi:peptide/nickel transport system substrate-binding protein
VGLPSDVATLDGHVRNTSASESIWQIYERLTALDATLQPQPMLAESWDVSTDYKQVKFNLRKGVQFHTGRELTSDDVKWNLVRVRDPKVGSGQMVNQSNWFTIDTPDKYTVTLSSDSPRPSMFDFFEFLNILDHVTMEGPDAKTRAVGTGPFSFVEWVQGDHLGFAKNANYWQTGRPYLDGFTAFIRQPDTTLVQLQAGALDLARSSVVRDIAQVKADPKFQAIVHPDPGSYLDMVVNVQNPPLDNKQVRQALNYALNRQRLSDSVYLGTNTPLALPWSESAIAYEPAKNAAYAFDLEKARSLLAEAGVSSLTLDLIIIQSSYPQLYEFGQIYQADLASLGVVLNLKPLDPATWIDQVLTHHYNGLEMGGDGYANLSTPTLLNSTPEFSPTANNAGFGSDTYTNLVAMVSAEPDPVRQKQLASQINDLLLDESFVMTLGTNPLTLLARAGVHGVAPSLHQGFLFTDVWLEP